MDSENEIHPVSNPEHRIERRSDTVLRNAVVTLTKAFSESLENLETTNLEILNRIDEIQQVSTINRGNQGKLLVEHERLVGRMDEVMSTVNKSIGSLAVQVQTLRTELKKYKETPSEE